MRIKDEHKQEAIITATIKLVNEIGFVASSVSKIAAEAEVSPATLYIYYKNKEDLLVSTYVDIKKNLSDAMLKGFDNDQPIRDILRKIWLKTFAYISENGEYFKYTEQFANSPYSGLVNMEQVNQYFEPLKKVFRRGIEQKIIKDVDIDLLWIFMIHPILALANPRLCKNFEMTDESVEAAFNLAWDAIKL